MRFETLPQAHTRPMKQHSYVSGGLAENITDLPGVTLLDFTQHEGVTLQFRQLVQACLDGVAGFRGRGQAIRLQRRPNPVPAPVKAGLTHLVDRIVLVVPRRVAIPFEPLAVQDPEQPRTYRRTALEMVERLDEGREDVLHQVFSFRMGAAYSARRTIERSRILLHRHSNHLGVSLVQPG